MAGFGPGDRVAYCLVWNSYAEFAVVPAWQLAHVPPAGPLALAAAATFQGFTARPADDPAIVRAAVVAAACGALGIPASA